MGKDTECAMMRPQDPTVAEATEDRAPPIRVSVCDGVARSPVLINSKEYQMPYGQLPVSDVDTHARAYASDKRHNEFNERDLPVLLGSDTTVLGEKEQQKALDVIASINEPVTITSGDDHPNQVADPETVGREEREKTRKEEERYQAEMRKYLRDPKVLDVLSHLLNSPNRETIRIDPRMLDSTTQCGKQCGGGNGSRSGKGSQTESSSNQSGQGGFVTGYSARSSLVVGLGGGGGGLGGAGGGDDEDPNNYHPFNITPSHYYDFMGYEEQPQREDDALRDAAMAVLTQGMVGNPMLSQFNNTQEEPLSCSLDGIRLPDFEEMDLDFSSDVLSNDAAQYLSHDDPMFQIAPAEESAAGVVQISQPLSDTFPMAEESSDIKDSFDLIHMMKPSTQRTHPQGKVIGITPQASSIPRSQIPGLNLPTSYPSSLPSPAPSNASSYMVPIPSPLPPRTPVTPVTPANPPPPSPLQTPSTPQPRGFFFPKSFIEGDKRVCELSISPDIWPEKRNTAFHAVFYMENFYTEVFQCSEMDMDLKVANDVRAKMCDMEFEAQSFKISLSMPKDCKPLSKWLRQHDTNLKDRLIVLQQILNTLATIHTLGYENTLALWGSFMVWVASDLRVYLLVDFALLLQKQEEMAYSDGKVNPRMLDVMTVKEIYQKLVRPCIGRDGSWASPSLRSALQAFEWMLTDTSSSCRMAEVARLLGEKRVCKVDVDVCLSVVFYCLEREELQTALRELAKIAPSRISRVWTVQSMTSGDFMRVGDIATADRPMHLCLKPCMHPSDAKLLYVVCEDSG